MLSACLLLAAFAWAEPSAEAAKYEGQDAAVWLARIDDPDDNVRRRACYALGTIRPVAPGVLEALAKVLHKDAQIEPRWYAIDALARLGPDAAGAQAAIVAALDSPLERDDYDIVRRLAARALGNIGPPAKASLPSLDKAIASDDPLLKVSAGLARWKITGEAASLRPLTEALARGTPEAAFEAALALREVGPAAKPAAKLLAQALGHADRDVRRAAASALAGLGFDAVAPITEALGEPASGIDAALAAGTLGQIALVARRTAIDPASASAVDRAATVQRFEQDLAPALAAMLADARPEVRRAAAGAIAQLGPPALPVLLTALGEGSPSARSAAAEALREVEPRLGKSPAGEYRGRSIPRVGALLRRTEPDVRQAAFRLFAALQVEPAEAADVAPLLRAALKDEDLAVRTYAAEALERLK